MASRAARSVFSAAARASRRPARVAQHIGRRYNSTSSHGSSATSSDKPWIIGSAVIFGPALLYLLSPSARKKSAEHAVHHDKEHEPAHAEKHEPTTETAASSTPPTEVIMKDDEGNEENVAESLAIAEHEDAPKAAVPGSEPASPNVSASSGTESVQAQSEDEVKSEKEAEEPVKAGEDGPTNLGEAREAAKEGKAPKQQAEGA